MLVEVQNVRKSHHLGGAEASVEVLKGVDFSLEERATAAILGPSGSGKSSLLNLIGALDVPDEGIIRVAGQDVSALKGKALAAYRSQTVGFVFQMHHLLPQCTVLENVMAPAVPCGRQMRKEAEGRARSLLDALGLAHRLAHRPAELSGGERQRVAVARAMVLNPRLLLADEPTGALDRAAASQLGEVLLEMNRRHGVALLVVTHSRELAGLLQRVLELRDGKLVSMS